MIGCHLTYWSTLIYYNWGFLFLFIGKRTHRSSAAAKICESLLSASLFAYIAFGSLLASISWSKGKHRKQNFAFEE